MKRYILLLLTVILFGNVHLFAQNNSPKKEKKPIEKNKTKPKLQQSNFSMPYQFGYYNISVEAVSGIQGLPFQSFVAGNSGDNILIVGGRSNGFHGTDGTDSAINFPAYFSNTNFIVYNPVTGLTKMAPLPVAYADQLSSTNMLGCQEGDTLYLCGGYGKNSAGNYVTYNGFFAISVSQMINAILNNQTANLTQYITNTTNNNMAVTGGELLKIGNYFYVVMGQNFTGLYAPTGNQQSTQIYTNAVRVFNVVNTGTSLTANLVSTLTDGNSPDATSRFHRRDLNVVPIIDTDGKGAIAVYGGVFTQKVNGIWQQPVYITQGTNNNPSAYVDTNFLQKFNQYGCAQVLAYEPRFNTMVTNLLGGISYYTYKNGVITPDANAPFVNVISTIFRNKTGTSEIYSSPNSGLPALVGAESKFFPLQQLLFNGSNEIIDLSKVPMTGQPFLVGYMYGGILASAPQSSTIYPTTANKVLYKVYITRRYWLANENK
jgi:hypothetical protein